MVKTKIKISSADDLRIIKGSPRELVPPKQIHKNKKAYVRRGKHQLKDFNN